MIHLDISGKYFKDLQFLKIEFILIVLDTFQLFIPNINNNDEHPLNILLKSVIEIFLYIDNEIPFISFDKLSISLVFELVLLIFDKLN